MKKFSTLMMIIVSMICLVSLTSCEDQMIAYDLEGTWQGDMYMVRDGRVASYSEIEFYGDPFRTTSGHGNWLDQYSSRPGDYFCSRISWKVIDRRIHIWLLDDCDQYGNPFELVISDYRLSGQRFTGYVDYEGGSREFSLYHTYSPHWEDYDYGYYDYYDEYYFSKGNKQPQPVVHTHEMRK